MTSDKTPITIKKYANRRLYNTGTSAYVTLEDLAGMVKHGEDFVVYDAKNGEDITRSVLGQIIFEQETKSGQSLLPTTFLRQLIRFYGSSLQMLVPSYLEMSLNSLTKEQGGGFLDQYATAFGNPSAFAAARPVFSQIEEQTRKNMALFRQALSMFPTMPGAAASMPNGAMAATEPEAAPDEPAPQPQPAQSREEFEQMKRQLEDLQRRIETLAPKV